MQYVILLGERIVEDFVQESESLIDFVVLFEIYYFLKNTFSIKSKILNAQQRSFELPQEPQR